MQIIERENEIINQMKKTRSEGGKIYCLGNGMTGKSVKRAAGLYDITIDMFFVSNKKYLAEENSIEGIPVLCLEDASRENYFSPKDLLVVCSTSCDNGVLNRYRSEISICREDPTSLWGTDGKILDYDYLLIYKDEFASLYRELADDRSRVCMDAFLNQKISGKLLYLDKVYDHGQYFDARIIRFNKIEGFVDCGAYDGDTYFAFREAYRMNTGKEYGGTAYLLEPNANSYKKMVENCSDFRNYTHFFPCGVWKKQDRLFFRLNETSSKIDESGTVSIDLNSIDNIVKGQRVDFIKMDIEGSELNALRGARKTIEAHKPILAICVYHKRDDLLTVPAYIRSVCPEYKFYLRAYTPFVQELVLYAVCE